MDHQRRTSRPATASPTGESTARTAVWVGVDTHRDRHHVAVLDSVGRELGDRSFAATAAGYAQLQQWVTNFGPVACAAIEGTGSYGAGLCRALTSAGWQVRDTVPGDKADRRRRGKTDTTDAYTAARAALSGQATAIPKSANHTAEAIRVLHVHRRMLVDQQTQLMNQLKSFLVTAPAPLREQFTGLTQVQLARTLAGRHPAATDDQVTTITLQVLADTATRWLDHRAQAAALATQLHTLLQAAAPALMAMHGVGPDVAARLLAAVGDNPTRIRSEAAMAHLFGIAPIEASSGNRHTHRLDRGGNRSANCAVHRIALVRMSRDPRTRDYITRCTHRGKTKRDAIRLLKRAIIRELYPALTQ